MPHNYQIKKYVVFTEFSAVPKEFAENIHFDIYYDGGYLIRLFHSVRNDEKK